MPLKIPTPEEYARKCAQKLAFIREDKRWIADQSDIEASEMKYGLPAMAAGDPEPGMNNPLYTDWRDASCIARQRQARRIRAKMAVNGTLPASIRGCVIVRTWLAQAYR